jgi:hypothetical protein
MSIHVYELGGAAPREELRCGPLEGTAAAAPCAGAARAVRLQPALREYEVQAPEAGHLLLRDTYAQGWRAWVDGTPAPVHAAGGRHQAVAVPAGRHQVRLDYAPPGLRPGLVLMALSVAAAVALALKPLV